MIPLALLLAGLLLASASLWQQIVADEAVADDWSSCYVCAGRLPASREVYVDQHQHRVCVSCWMILQQAVGSQERAA